MQRLHEGPTAPCGTYQVRDQLETLMPSPPALAAVPAAPAAEGAMETDEAPAAAPAAPLSEADAKLYAKLVKVKDILSGKIPIGLYLDFLFRCGLLSSDIPPPAQSLERLWPVANPSLGLLPRCALGTTTRTSRSSRTSRLPWRAATA